MAEEDYYLLEELPERVQELFELRWKRRKLGIMLITSLRKTSYKLCNWLYATDTRSGRNNGLTEEDCEEIKQLLMPLLFGDKENS